MDQGKIMTKYVLKVQLNIPPQYPTIYSAHLSKLDNYLKKNLITCPLSVLTYCPPSSKYAWALILLQNVPKLRRKALY